MIDRARWILLGAAMLLMMVALSWSCGGGGGGPSSCSTFAGVAVGCGTPAPAGPILQGISICPGPPPSPTPVPVTTASTSPTPMEPTCPTPIVTAVPKQTLQFHAVGIFSNNSTQDITNSPSTLWTTNNSSVVTPNTSPPGSFFAVASGCAGVNATSGGISGSAIVDVEPVPASCPSPGPAAADPFVEERK